MQLARAVFYCACRPVLEKSRQYGLQAGVHESIHASDYDDVDAQNIALSCSWFYVIMSRNHQKRRGQ
jgi:hypothetical protein